MNLRTFPTARAWRRHTATAKRTGLSAAALACLGDKPHAIPDPKSFTGWIGIVTLLNHDDAITAGQLAAQAIGAGRGTVAKPLQTGFWHLHVPISRTAAEELTPPKRVPTIASPGHGQRTAAYDAIMRPTARARIKANAILQEA